MGTSIPFGSKLLPMDLVVIRNPRPLGHAVKWLRIPFTLGSFFIPGRSWLGTTIANERSHVEACEGILCLSNDGTFLRRFDQAPHAINVFHPEFRLALPRSQKGTSCPRRLWQSAPRVR